MRFRPNPNFRRELQRDPRIRETIRGEAAEAKRHATMLSQAFRHTGYYSRRFVVTDDGEAVLLGNTDPFAHLIEWGSINNPPYAPLRRGALAAGYRLDGP